MFLLSIGFKYKLLQEEDQYTLAVVEVEPSDAGLYECEALNEVGSSKSSAMLEVDCKDVAPVAKTPDMSPPSIVEPIQDFITREGQSARFQCKVVGTGWYLLVI